MNSLRLFSSNASRVRSDLWSSILIHYSCLMSYIWLEVLSRHCDISSVDRNTRPVAPLIEPAAKYRPRLSVRLHNPVSPKPAIYGIIFKNCMNQAHNRKCLSHVSFPDCLGLHDLNAIWYECTKSNKPILNLIMVISNNENVIFFWCWATVSRGIMRDDRQGASFQYFLSYVPSFSLRKFFLGWTTAGASS